LTTEHGSYPWLFRGAHAIYRGSAKVGDLPGEFDVTEELSVEDVDLANGMVKLRDRTTIVQRLWKTSKKVSETDFADWVEIGGRTLLSDIPVKLEGECEGQTYVKGLGIRRCVIQHYAVRRDSAIVFWDKEYNWPLQLIAIFRYKRKSSSESFEFLAEAARDVAELWAESFERVTGESLDLNMQDELKKSESVVLRESSIAISLKETNIPFIPLPPPPPPSRFPLTPPPPNHGSPQLERSIQCEYLENDGSCRAIDKDEWTGRETCLNFKKDCCCYQCSIRGSCQISCAYLDGK